MGWAVCYQLNRDKILTTKERKRLIAHVVEHNDPPRHWTPYDLQMATKSRPDGAIAWGFTKLTFDQDSPEGDDDIYRLLTALTELRMLVDGAQCSVECDFGSILWDEKSQSYTNHAGSADSPITFVVFVKGVQSALGQAKV